LLAGTVHYRSGNLEDAQRALQTVLRDGAAREATRNKAHFVAGLMAADRADPSGLRKHISALGTAASGAAEADVLELPGRLLDLEGNVDGALLRLDQTAMQRSRERDYRGMVRALATAGDLAERAGRVGLAANYLLRAGRSAAHGSGPEAAEWLQRARALGERSGDRALVVEAEALLDTIEAGP